MFLQRIVQQASLGASYYICTKAWFFPKMLPIINCCSSPGHLVLKSKIYPWKSVSAWLREELTVHSVLGFR